MTGIEVAAAHPMFLFLYFVLWTPRVVVDGVEHRARWQATTSLPATVGEHEVVVYYRLYWLLPAGRASTTVRVAEGETVRLRYRPSLFVLGPGRLHPV
jgi:hypothetical protein